MVISKLMKKHLLKILATVFILGAIVWGLSLTIHKLEKASPYQATVTPQKPKKIITASKQILGTGRQIFLIDIALPENHEFAPESPSSMTWMSKDPNILNFEHFGGSMDFATIEHPIAASFSTNPGTTEVLFDFDVYYCDKKTKICLFEKKILSLPVEVIETAAAAFTRIQLSIPPKKLS